MLSVKNKRIVLMMLNHCDRIMKKLNDIKESDFYNDNDLQEIIAFNLFQIGDKYSNSTTLGIRIHKDLKVK